MGAGRPVSVYTKKRLAELKKQMEEYTDKTAIPILAEFAYTHDVLRQELYKHPELGDTIKKMMHKKEAQLEKLALSGKAPPAMCIFSLKQLGWRDKQETEHTGKITHDVKSWGEVMGGDGPETE